MSILSVQEISKSYKLRKVVKGIKGNKGVMMFSALTRITYGMKRISPPFLYEKHLKQFARLARSLQE